jgi:hypothetical protein
MTVIDRIFCISLSIRLAVLAVLITSCLSASAAEALLVYRLGDAVHSPDYRKEVYATYTAWHEEAPFFRKPANEATLAESYMARTNQSDRFDILTQLVKQYAAHHPIPLADATTAVVHLRTGDVIEDSSHSVGKFLQSATPSFTGKTPQVYVLPLVHYRHIITQLKKLRIGRLSPSNIIIVTGFHLNSANTTHHKSFEYIDRISSLFKSNGFNVTKQINER